MEMKRCRFARLLTTVCLLASLNRETAPFAAAALAPAPNMEAAYVAAAAAGECYDSCTMGCVNPNQGVKERCGEECRVKCEPTGGNDKNNGGGGGDRRPGIN